ncbi:MAG: collagen-like protein, partial [Muriicola sp.]|nr:collagen-like protein [Muriicola sp.]
YYSGSQWTNLSNGNTTKGNFSFVDNGNGTITINYSDGTSFTSSDLTGPQGPAGLDGAVGPAGPQGPAGINGTEVSGTSGSIFFAGSDGKITENNSQVFWDNTNNRLGVAINSPSEKLDINGSVRLRSISNAINTDDILAIDASGVLKKSRINYGARWINSNTSTNLNANNTIAPIFGIADYNDDSSNLYIATSTTLTVKEAGRYDIRANLSLEGINSSGNTEQRTNVNARIAVNGTAVGAIGASGYIRWASNQNHSSIHVSEILELPANAVITIITYREANSGTVRFSGTGESSFVINKLR